MEFLFLYIFLTFAFILFITLRKIYVSTAAMAVVMSLGIMTEGVLLNFFGTDFFYGTMGRILTIIDLAMWTSFIFSFIYSYCTKKFSEVHFSNPINRFGMGTWVAGTSICGILIDKQFSEWSLLVKLLLCLNLCLWAFYIWICLKTLADVVKSQLIKRVHGVLLLTTVSTQSLVLLAGTIYKNVPYSVDLAFITIGSCFYLFSIFLIIKRYSGTGSWSIRTDWNNTNCILHGALSITGLSCLVSHLLSKDGVLVIWICAAMAFLIVESIELYRLSERIKYYGWKRAIVVYDVSQWSRIFTFAMFYTFTYLSGTDNTIVISFIQKVIIISGIWIILLLTVLEIGLAVKFLRDTTPRKLNRTPSGGIDSSF